MIRGRRLGRIPSPEHRGERAVAKDMRRPVTRSAAGVAMGIGLRASAAWALVLVGVSASAGLAQRPHAIRGIVRDSASRLPLAGALVDVRSAALRLTARTDEDGAFRFNGLLTGRYTYSILRIGFAERTGDIELTDQMRDTTVAVYMRPLPQVLDAFRVRGDVSAIYGMVGTLPDLAPLAGARVQIIGGSEAVTTGADGGFFVPAEGPGSYLVRITADGYADRLFNVEIPRGRAVEASRLLDPGAGAPKALEGVYDDLAQRLRFRGMNSALVSGAELRRAGSNVVDAVQASRAFTAPGLRFGPSVCLFVNGIARPGATVEAYRVDEVEAIEVYAGNGDKSGDLARRWPANAPCGQIFRTFARGGPTANLVRYVVIWLRK